MNDKKGNEEVNDVWDFIRTYDLLWKDEDISKQLLPKINQYWFNNLVSLDYIVYLYLSNWELTQVNIKMELIEMFLIEQGK